MTIQTDSFARKTFDVEAIRVTAENMDEVAAWCNGNIQNVNPDKYGGQDICIKVEVKRAGSTPMRQTMAFPGDWVLVMNTAKKDNSFRVYSDKAFKASFESKAQAALF